MYQELKVRRPFMKKIILILVLTLALTLSACSGGNDEFTIKLGYWYSNENEKENNQLIIDEFLKLYPEYEIELVYIPYGSYSEQVLSMSVAKNLPDVMWVVEDYLPTFAEKGIIENLEPYIEADETFDSSIFFDNALEFTQVDGIQYALPRDIGVQVMAYNKTLFDEAGVDYPSYDWTWDDMISIGEDLTITDGDRISQYGLGWLDYEALIYSNNGRMFNDEGTVAYFDTQATIDGLQMYSDLVNLYHISPTPSESQGLGNVFFGSTAAMTLVGPWDFSILEKSQIDYDIVPFPDGENGESQMRLSGLPVALSSQSDKKEIGYELIKFLTTNETAQSMLAEYGIAMPAVESIARSEVYTESSIVPDSMDAYFEALENTQVIPHFAKEIEALNALSPFLDQIYMDEKTADQLKDEIMEAVTDVLND
jgi:multiple sugar transport system substrate-binding protein